jgi:hypothetical protein
MNSTLEVADVDPTVAAFDLLQRLETFTFEAIDRSGEHSRQTTHQFGESLI